MCVLCVCMYVCLCLRDCVCVCACVCQILWRDNPMYTKATQILNACCWCCRISSLDGMCSPMYTKATHPTYRCILLGDTLHTLLLLNIHRHLLHACRHNTHTYTAYPTTTTKPLQYPHTFTHTFVVIINTRRLNQRPTLFCFARRRSADAEKGVAAF